MALDGLPSPTANRRVNERLSPAGTLRKLGTVKPDRTSGIVLPASTKDTPPVLKELEIGNVAPGIGLARSE